MTELKLVAPDQPTPLERQLLSAAANESPSAEQRLRVRQALGLPAIAVAPPVAVPSGRRALVVKAAVGSLIVGSIAALFVLSSQSTPSLAKPSAPTPSVVAAPAPEVEAVTPAPVAQALPAPESAAPSAPRKSPVRAAAAAIDAQADLSEQLRLIEAARGAVAARDAKAASAALSEYGSRFPRGVFGQEAAVLRIETLDVQGNHAQAAKLAQAFLARHPNSPHVNVVRRIAGTTP